MHLYKLSSPSESLTATTAKSVLGLILGSTRRAKVVSILMTGSSVTASDTPVLIELCTTNQGAAGTATSVTPAAIDRADPACIATAARTYTVEPTTITIIDPGFRVSPIGNSFLWELPPGREIALAVSTTFVIRVTAPQNQSNMSFTIVFAE